jgi:hypothetical protein
LMFWPEISRIWASKVATPIQSTWYQFQYSMIRQPFHYLFTINFKIHWTELREGSCIMYIGPTSMAFVCNHAYIVSLATFHWYSFHPFGICSLSLSLSLYIYIFFIF